MPVNLGKEPVTGFRSARTRDRFILFRTIAMEDGLAD
jgi:hypothetical protein